MSLQSDLINGPELIEKTMNLYTVCDNVPPNEKVTELLSTIVGKVPH